MKQKNGLTNKEILIAYCNTLSESASQKAYVILQEEFGTRKIKYMKFDGTGTECKNGVVRLRKQDYNKIIAEYGLEYFLQACTKMAGYIQFLQDNEEYNPKYKRTLRDLKTRNHYIDITKGWIARDLDAEGCKRNKQSKCDIDFFDIENPTQAREYISHIPKELRVNNYEVEFLFNKYPELLEE